MATVTPMTCCKCGTAMPCSSVYAVTDGYTGEVDCPHCGQHHDVSMLREFKASLPLTLREKFATTTIVVAIIAAAVLVAWLLS